jgi:hypothetical protein
MGVAGRKRRRSDEPAFVQTDADIDALAEEIFSRYVGQQSVIVDGAPYSATFFRQEYCPDLRVMKLAGHLALAVNRRAAEEGRQGLPGDREEGRQGLPGDREEGRQGLPGDREEGDGIVESLRVTIPEIMLAALLHDLGKQHEDCAPFIQLLADQDLRGDSSVEAARRKDYLLGIVRDVHCRKGPCMIDRLRDAGRSELNNPFIGTVARRHGHDYQDNRAEGQGCWWAREINVVTIADDYDALTSGGPERSYKQKNLSPDEAAALLRAGAARGRYEPRLTEIFIGDVLRLDRVETPTH